VSLSEIKPEEWVGCRQGLDGRIPDEVYWTTLLQMNAILKIKNILITGPPGIGKTTLIKKIEGELAESHPAGFYTEEIRENGARKGFELISLSGRRGLLSHVNIRSPYRVSKYGVDVKIFEDFLDLIPFFAPETEIVIIDEIGKMECFSQKFEQLVKRFLDSEKKFIATISLKGSGFIAQVKKRNDIKLFEMSPSNRDALLSEILREVSAL
jgi:nucleoside-triphosphatase